MAAEFLRLGSEELLARVLAPGQRRRVEATYAEATRLYDRKVSQGARLREDEFFHPPKIWPEALSAPWGTLPPPAAEIIEALLVEAGQTFEERKLPFLAHMLVELLFRPDVTPGHAHQLCRVAAQLSWRQYGLLALFDAPVRPGQWTDSDVRPDHPSGLGRELAELGGLGLVGLNEPEGDAYPTDSISDVSLKFLKTTYQGRLLAELLGLEALPTEAKAHLLDEVGAVSRR